MKPAADRAREFVRNPDWQGERGLERAVTRLLEEAETLAVEDVAARIERHAETMLAAADAVSDPDTAAKLRDKGKTTREAALLARERS